MLLLSLAHSDSTTQSVNNSVSMLKQQLAVKKDKKKVKNVGKVNYPKWLTKSYQANN